MVLDKFNFRGLSLESGEWVYGWYFVENQLGLLRHVITRYERLKGHQVYIEVDGDTVGQYTTFNDKHGNPIFEGDVLRNVSPERDYQTHYGDNIPMGEYTEPLEPIIEYYHHVVSQNEGSFVIDDVPFDGPSTVPLSYVNMEWDLESAKNAFSSGIGYQNSSRWEWEGEEGDLEYLLNEYGIESESKLIESLGVEIRGDIHTNEEYKEWTK